jgi:hypothetical protein
MKGRSKDRGRYAAEPWEVERLHREFPVQSEEELERALENCKAEKQTQDKDKTARCVQRKLSK